MSINCNVDLAGKACMVRYKKRKGVVVLRQYRDLIFLSGHGPEDQITGKPLYCGKIGKELSTQDGYFAARECGIILLGALRDYLGSLDTVKGTVKAFGLVSCTNDFYDQELVFNGFSDLMVEVLAERGYHTRTVAGTSNLPNGNIPIEIELVVQI